MRMLLRQSGEKLLSDLGPRSRQTILTFATVKNDK